MDTFTWIPSSQTTADGSASVHEVQYSDGYVGRGGNGINSCKEDWNLVFDVLKPEEGAAIRDFFKAHGGYIAFQWTPPFEDTPRNFICKTWQPGFVGGRIVSLGAKFEETFAPGG